VETRPALLGPQTAAVARGQGTRGESEAVSRAGGGGELILEEKAGKHFSHVEFRGTRGKGVPVETQSLVVLLVRRERAAVGTVHAEAAIAVYRPR
jgi:hypothetical protein